MSFSPSASETFTPAASSPTSFPPHAIQLLEYIDRSDPSSPAIASLVSSAPPIVSISLETPKSKPSASSFNATHRKGQTGMNGGRWTEKEHHSFLAGLRLYGREWKKVAGKIKTRTSAQIRSHAQKHFAKLMRDGEMRERCGLVMSIPGPVNYFSDGGSSIAQNSGDDDDNPPVPSREQLVRARSTGQAKRSADIAIAPMGSATGGRYNPTAGTTKKRSRSRRASFDNHLGMDSPVSTYPCKLFKRTNGTTRVKLLPSQEELLAKTSPNLRHRLSCLIDAELCALQVLSCYAMLQQHDHVSAPPLSVKRQHKHRKMATATASAAGSATASLLGLSLLSTEQIRPASSIY